MNGVPLIVVSALRDAGREPVVPFRVQLADGRELTVRRLLRVLPGKRLVGEAELEGRRVLAKLFIAPRGERHWQRERDGLEALRLAAVPTPALVAATAIAGGGHALLTDFLEPAESLAETWQRLSRQVPGEAVAMTALAPAVTVLGRLHAAGLLHEDLHLGNFLRHEGALFVIDGDAVQAIHPGRPLAAAQACANLAVLLAQLPAEWDALVGSWLSAYAAGSAGALPEVEAGALLAQIRQVRARRLADFLAKTVRECTLFAVTHDTRRFAAVVRPEASRLAELLAHPDRAIDAGEILKDGGTCTVARGVVDGRALLIKRYNLKSLRHALSRAWRPSRAWHSWREAHRLQFLGIPTPAPLALLEERYGPLRRRAWLVSEFCPGPDLLRHLCADREPPDVEARAILALFESLHRQRISHGDLKATNLLWHAGRVLLIDLDAVVQHRSNGAHARAWRRDRARLLRNWPPESVLHRWFDDRLPAAA